MDYEMDMEYGILDPDTMIDIEYGYDGIPDYDYDLEMGFDPYEGSYTWDC